MSLRFRSVLSAPFGYSASCSSFQPSIGSASQWLSQRPALSSRFLRIFPFHPVWFPIQSFRFCLFGLLFVSFHPSLLRSHSRSTGAHVQSPSFPPAPFRVFSCRPLPFVHVRFRARLLSSLFLPFPSSTFSLTAGPVCFLFRHSLRLFPCGLPAFGTQPCCNSFLHRPFASQRLPSSADPARTFLCLFRSFPLACALGSVYSARYDVP